MIVATIKFPIHSKPYSINHYSSQISKFTPYVFNYVCMNLAALHNYNYVHVRMSQNNSTWGLIVHTEDFAFINNLLLCEWQL